MVFSTITRRTAIVLLPTRTSYFLYSIQLQIGAERMCTLKENYSILFGMHSFHLSTLIINTREFFLSQTKSQMTPTMPSDKKLYSVNKIPYANILRFLYHIPIIYPLIILFTNVFIITLTNCLFVIYFQ